MSKRNPWGEFFQNFDSAYNLGNKVGLQIGMAKAADVKPETIANTSLTDTTPNQEGMVYDADTGQYLPKYLDKSGQPTEQAQTQLNTPAEGESEAPVGMQPTFAPRTTTSYKMGGKVQEQPFTQEQIDAQKFRNQADVYTHYGMADKAAQLHGLAKGREEEGVTNQIRTAAMDGMKSTKDMRDEEKMFAMSKNMYEASIRLNRPDLATGYYQQMQQSREGLLSNSWDRAERVRRATISDSNPTGSIAGFIDVQNKYVGNGLIIPEFKENVDGKGGVWIKVKDEISGKESETTVPKEKIGDYLLQMKDIKKVEAIEQARSKSLFDEQIKTREALAKPMEVHKDSRIVIPGTGKEIGTKQANGRLDPKEHQAVLDDARNLALQNFGTFDAVSGKFVPTEKSQQVAAAMESLYSNGGHALPVTTLQSIATSGKLGMHTVAINGQPTTIEGYAYKGTLYPLQPGIGAVPMKTPSDAAGSEVPGSVKRRFSGLQSPDTFSKTRENMGAGAPVLKRTTSGTGQSTGGTVSGMQRIEPTAYNAPELDQIAVSAAQESGIPPKLLLAIKNAGEKSNNDQVSKKGAAGVMQFMPETAKAYGVDSANPESAIKGAGRYLADLIKQYRGNVAAAVAHYNGGSTQGALVAAGKPPTYPETRAYLERVLAASEAPA